MAFRCSQIDHLGVVDWMTLPQTSCIAVASNKYTRGMRWISSWCYWLCIDEHSIKEVAYLGMFSFKTCKLTTKQETSCRSPEWQTLNISKIYGDEGPARYVFESRARMLYVYIGMYVCVYNFIYIYIHTYASESVCMSYIYMYILCSSPLLSYKQTQVQNNMK